jgi:hypothetical protein
MGVSSGLIFDVVLARKSCPGGAEDQYADEMAVTERRSKNVKRIQEITDQAGMA